MVDRFSTRMPAARNSPFAIRAAAWPMTGGVATGTAPTVVLHQVRYFMGE
jgi:hypothetical protein